MAGGRPERAQRVEAPNPAAPILLRSCTKHWGELRSSPKGNRLSVSFDSIRFHPGRGIREALCIEVWPTAKGETSGFPLGEDPSDLYRSDAPVAQLEEQHPSKVKVGRSTRPGRVFYQLNWPLAESNASYSATEAGYPAKLGGRRKCRVPRGNRPTEAGYPAKLGGRRKCRKPQDCGPGRVFSLFSP